MNKPNNVHCFRCLGPHFASYNKCPARNQICIKCGIESHFERACFRTEKKDNSEDIERVN